MKDFFLFLYSALCVLSTGYVVFFRDASGWWFALAAYLIIMYGNVSHKAELDNAERNKKCTDQLSK